MNSDQLINQDSGNFEYYTPPFLVESARRVMGSIDLDPASCSIANDKIVKADTFYTIEDNGLEKIWHGNVWMNHPFSKGEKACAKFKTKGREHEYNCKKKTCKDRGYHIDKDVPGNIDWINKLMNSYHVGEVAQSINICFANTSETWFEPLLDHPQCFIKGRINYVDENLNVVKGVTKGSVITYLGDDYLAFKREFSQYGKVK